ncbi:hypothetical protein SAY86_008100 [Trapa natans]|uniref:Storage protein n=1 Tax=Trapa natans TaxID=22666 RepID=A0AAN7QAA9_TRANT|nr:hypothetical protein SAY86_008100 [Trapa natans]
MLYQQAFNKMGAGPCARSDPMRSTFMIFMAIAFGFFIGTFFPSSSSSISKLSISTNLLPCMEASCPKFGAQEIKDQPRSSSLVSNEIHNTSANQAQGDIWVPTNPRGAERLPPGIVVAESDLYLRRLWGNPSEDLTSQPKYLVTFTVGYEQRRNVDAAIKKFSGNFTIMMFHYDGRTTEWDEYGWSRKAIHVSVPKQTKWWYAKRFLHPDIVAPYDYIFIWDEDLGVENFNAEEYIKQVRKHGLEISQPALDPSSRGLTWRITRRRDGQEIHRETDENPIPTWCHGPREPPCAGFVEIMAPVFSRDAWRCVWHLIQNDLVHGWGLDFSLRRCAKPAHEKIGVVDSQWIFHQAVPSLGNQGEASQGKKAWQGVRERCKMEWGMFSKRLAAADEDYLRPK